MDVDDGYDAVASELRRGAFAAADEQLDAVLARTGGVLSLRVATLATAVKLSRGHYDAALAYLAVTQPHQPDALDQLKHTGAALTMLGRGAEAQPVLQRAIERYPHDAELRYLLSIALPDSGRPDDYRAAQEHALRATELDPQNWSYHFRYGTILQHSGRVSEAEAALRVAATLQPEHGPIWEQLGTALLELDRTDEAIAAYERALALDPRDAAARRALHDLRRSAGPAGRDRLARFPRAVRDFADVDDIIERFIVPDFSDPPVLLTPASTVFTLGSCFAKNIANALRRSGVAAQHVLYPDDINSTYANRALLEWLLGAQGPAYAAYEAEFGDDFRREQTAYLCGCDVVIVSLGVAPCFFDRETGAFVLTFGHNLNVALRNRSYRFRTTTVAENVDNLRVMVDLLRRLNPRVAIVLTVSPVPLRATFERGSAIVADCVSKSTLRVAAEEIVRLDLPDVYYWPSFEIVRWAGGYTGEAFGVDDGSSSHVTQSLVERIMDAFVATFGTSELRARLRGDLPHDHRVAINGDDVAHVDASAGGDVVGEPEVA